MKLIKCYISAFGKLKDFSYDFSDNLNTIVRENGWGKSTFATFIKSMFYGLNDSKRSVAENERIKYKPWGSTDKFGGYLIFTVNENKYKLERFFGAKATDDTVRLFDTVSGKEYPVKEELGKHIFKIDEDGFLSTTYFSQKDFQVKSNTTLTAKFNDVCEIQDSDAFDKALKKIEDRAKTYKYRGDRGLIPDAKRELFSVEEEIVRAERSVGTVLKLKQDAEILNKEIEGLQFKTNALTERVGVAGKAEALAVKKNRHDKLIKEKSELTETAATAKEVLNGNSVVRQQIEECEKKNLELVSIDARINSVKSDITALEESKNSLANKKLSRFDVTLYVISIICCISFFALRIALGYSAITVVFGVLYAFSVIAVIVDRIYKLTIKRYKNGGVKEILEQKIRELSLLENQKNEIEHYIDSYISRFNLGKTFDRADSLNYIAKVGDIDVDINKKLIEVDKELSELNFNAEEYENVKNGVEDIFSLNEQLKSVQFEYNKKTRELAEKRSAIRAHEEFASSITDLESRRAELNEKIQVYEEEQDILNQTAKFLKLADENLKIKYKAPLQSSLKKYFDTVNGEEKPVNIDIDFKVTVEENGEQKVTDYYSKGYQNLFEICKRFALTDVLFTGEKPFIILDDPFYNLDEVKLQSSLELIKELSKEYQILYLVCHESRGA